MRVRAVGPVWLRSIATSVEECPANAPKFDKGGSLLGKSQAPKSNLATSARKKDAAKDQQKGPSITIDVAILAQPDQDPGQGRCAPREGDHDHEAPDQELPVDSPKRPEIVLRLAETYFELQQTTNAKVRALDEPIYEAQQQKNTEKVKQLQDQQKQLEKKNEEYRKEAIKTYATLVQDHPNYKRMDEVLFAFGFSLDEMKQFEMAREVYHRLIKSFPESEFVPNAYLSFAEYYFQQGDMRAANKFYRRSPSSRQSATRSTATRSTSRPGVTTTWRTSRALSSTSSR